MPTKSFRGMIANESTQTIQLSTNKGSTGYRIVKFQLMPDNPGTADVEHVVKIFSIPQSGSPDGIIDFSDNTLLAAGYLVDSNAVGNTSYLSTIFDNIKFNQDIYVSHKGLVDNSPCNYYIELETMPLALDENTVATLKDIRNIESNG